MPRQGHQDWLYPSQPPRAELATTTLDRRRVGGIAALPTQHRRDTIKSLLLTDETSPT